MVGCRDMPALSLSVTSKFSCHKVQISFLVNWAYKLPHVSSKLAFYFAVIALVMSLAVVLIGTHYEQSITTTGSFCSYVPEGKMEQV